MKKSILLGFIIAILYATINNVAYAQKEEFSNFWEDMFAQEEDDDSTESPPPPVAGESTTNDSTPPVVADDGSTSTANDTKESTAEVVDGNSLPPPETENPVTNDSATTISETDTANSTENQSSTSVNIIPSETDATNQSSTSVNIIPNETDATNQSSTSINIIPRETDATNQSSTSINIIPRETDATNSTSINIIRRPSKYYPNLHKDLPKKVEYDLKTEPNKPLKYIDISQNYDPDSDQIILEHSNNAKANIHHEDRSLTYRPKKGFVGNDKFTYTVTRPDGKVYIFVIYVEVREQIQKGNKYVIDFYDYNKGDIVESGVIAIIDISANYDPLYQILTLKYLNGYVVNNKDGTLTYYSESNFVGTDTFSYTVEDSSGYKTEFPVKVKVVKADDWPPVKICKVILVHDEGISDTQFLTLDPLAKERRNADILGPMYKKLDIEGMAISPVTKLMYAASGLATSIGNALDGYLFLVDAQTGNIRVVGDTGYSQLTALTFNYDGTLLLGWTGRGAKGKKVKEPLTKSGLILIDPDTAKSQFIYSPFWVNNNSVSPNWHKKRFVGGIAWDSARKDTMYLSENKRLWVLDTPDYGTTFNLSLKTKSFEKSRCKLPGEVEALETLDGGLLLFSLHNDRGNCIYVYNPDKCEIIEAHSFTTALESSDVESIVWPPCGKRSSPTGEAKALPPSNLSSCECAGVSKKQCKKL